MCPERSVSGGEGTQNPASCPWPSVSAAPLPFHKNRRGPGCPTQPPRGHPAKKRHHQLGRSHAVHVSNIQRQPSSLYYVCFCGPPLCSHFLNYSGRRCQCDFLRQNTRKTNLWKGRNIYELSVAGMSYKPYAPHCVTLTLVRLVPTLAQFIQQA